MFYTKWNIMVWIHSIHMHPFCLHTHPVNVLKMYQQMYHLIRQYWRPNVMSLSWNCFCKVISFVTGNRTFHIIIAWLVFKKNFTSRFSRVFNLMRTRWRSNPAPFSQSSCLRTNWSSKNGSPDHFFFWKLALIIFLGCYHFCKIYSFRFHLHCSLGLHMIEDLIWSQSKKYLNELISSFQTVHFQYQMIQSLIF